MSRARLLWHGRVGGGGGGGTVPAILAAPYLVEDYTDLGTPAPDIVIGRTYYPYFGSWSNSPTEWDWAVTRPSTGDILESGAHVTEQGDGSWTPMDEQVGWTGRLEALARNLTGDGATAPSSSFTISAINVTNAIDAWARTSSSGTTPIGATISYGPNARAGNTLGFNVYSDSGKTNLLGTYTHELTDADMAGGAINIDALGVSYTATNWIEAFYQALSPGRVPYTYTYPTAISPT